MPRTIRCPFCQTSCTVPDGQGGKKITCGACAYQFMPGGPAVAEREPPVVAVVAYPDNRPVRGSEPRESKPPRQRPAPAASREPSQPSASYLPLIAVGVGLAVTALVLIVGGAAVAAYLLLGRSSPPAVAVGPVANGQNPPAVQAVDAPANFVAQPGQQAAAAPVVLAPAPAPPAGAAAAPDGALSLEMLQYIKNASVFIKTGLGATTQTGSGFLISVQGDNGYILTNHHVVTVQAERRQPAPVQPGFPQPVIPRPPAVPRPGVPRPLPRIPRVSRTQFGGNPGGGLGSQPAPTVVFYSGTPQERALQGEVVTSNQDVDLALIRVSGVKNLPRPIDWARPATLVETTPVFLVGYPFGEALALDRGNPAVTVGRGTVSSLRRNDRGEMLVVQIDGDLNPGNSGGPVLDSQGRLVGVAFAVVRGSRIGLAVAPEQIPRVIAGQMR